MTIRSLRVIVGTSPEDRRKGEKPIVKFGLQTYGAKLEWQKNPERFFETIQALGYRQLEPCITFDEEEGNPQGFWTPAQAERYAPALENLDMLYRSAHVFTGDLEKALPEMIRLAERCGIQEYVLPCPGEIAVDVYLSYAALCKRCAAVLKEHGIGLLFHNGGREIQGKLGGKTAYEYLLDACGGLVGAQPDIGWLYAGGEDPEAFLWRNEARVCSLHYKDMKAGTPAKEVPVGEGDLDLLASFQFARAHGIPQIVDMDVCTLKEIENASRALAGMTFRRERTSSVLCSLEVDTGELRELHRFENVIEAPNWMQDGSILYNADGRIYRYFPVGDRIEAVDTGDCVHCNNDHVPSPDNRQLAVSHFAGTGRESNVYIVELASGKVRLVTEKSPSYLHGWSPDGKELAYCAFRKTDGENCVDIYAISADGGEEIRLTDGVGYNDGPEYAPDGRFIWFNSTRSGLMQVWRMDREGENLVQMTWDDANNWFPHVSPDGKRVVYLTFGRDELEPHEHLPNMRVSLSVMDSNGENPRKLLNFFGGQGSINVNSWAPDSRRVALVIYKLEHR